MRVFFPFILAIITLIVFPSCKSSNDEIEIPIEDETPDPDGNKFPTEENIEKYISQGWVKYSYFGAIGDGKTDDIENLIKTHDFANQHNLAVRADSNVSYYIGGKDRTVEVRTKTDFGNAKFIIDDRSVENRNSHVFSINSLEGPFKLGNVTSLKKNQKNIGLTLPGRCFVTVTNSNVKRYKRYGPNQNNGSSQLDIIIVDKNGDVDEKTPILWDFDQITDISFSLIDESELIITGGHFTTIANKNSSEYNYYRRGILVNRSNVIIDGIQHLVTGEGLTGAPYNSFIEVVNCSDVTVKNALLTGRKLYKNTSGVSMGTYDININKAINVTFENCSQSNDIHDSTFWGIMGSNYCKNLVYDNCNLSRFDAHIGVHNATVRNSSIGWQGVSIIGSGSFILDNTTIYSNNLIGLRSDYGSTWEGMFIIKDCVFVPLGTGSVNLIGGSYTGQHDFGYTCYMPESVMIENLLIQDSNRSSNYKGVAIFANINDKMTDDTYVEKYPYVLTQTVVLNNVKSSSGIPLRVSDNVFMFKDVSIVYAHN